MPSHRIDITDPGVAPTAAPCQAGTGTMRPRVALRTPGIITRRLISLVVRATAITTMAFGVAFGFLSATTSPNSHYDPQLFAIGVAALFGAACGGLGIMLSRIRQMKAELRQLEGRLDAAEDRHWEFKESQERANSFFEAQGDVIARRDGNGTITYANDTFCSFAGRSREELIGTSFALPVEQQAKPQSFRTARTSTTKRSPRPMAHAGSPGVKSPCAPTPAARCKASAAM